MGITQYASKPPNSGTEAEGRFCKLDFAHEFVLRYELCPKGRSSFPLHRREKRLSGNAGSVQSNPRSDS